jgi:WxL domain surface cell wall-binding
MKNFSRPVKTIVASVAAVGILALGGALPAFADGGGDSNLTITGGSLSVTGAAPGSFTANVTLSNQTVYTTLGTYSVSDATGTGAGYHHVDSVATPFTCAYDASTNANCPVAGDVLADGSLIMAAPTVAVSGQTVSSGRSLKPAVVPSGPTSIDSLAGTSVPVLNADTNTGMGSYTATPGDISGHTGKQLQLSLPRNIYGAVYTSTLTVSTVSGPTS